MCIRDSYTASNGNGITAVDFFVSDAAKLESIVQEVQNSTSIDWNSYYGYWLEYLREQQLMPLWSWLNCQKMRRNKL